MKNLFSLLSAAFLIAAFAGCSQADFLNPTDALARRLSFTDSGCTENDGLAKTTGGAPLCIAYNSGALSVTTNILTQCAAKFSDSTDVKENEINIFLTDTNPNGAKCVCPFVETSVFRLSGKGEYKIAVRVKPYASKDFILYADTTIVIK
jgi:hypothetical protein